MWDAEEKKREKDGVGIFEFSATLSERIGGGKHKNKVIGDDGPARLSRHGASRFLLRSFWNDLGVRLRRFETPTVSACTLRHPRHPCSNFRQLCNSRRLGTEVYCTFLVRQSTAQSTLEEAAPCNPPPKW